MSLKSKLITSVLMFFLVLVLTLVCVFAAVKADVELKGNLNFTATSVYARVTGSISGMQEPTITLPVLTFSEYAGDKLSSQEEINQWKGHNLNFTESAGPITFTITVENLSPDRVLYVMVKDQVGAVVNLNKTVTAPSYSDALNQSIEVAGGSSVTITITFTVAQANEIVNGTYDYLISLMDESLINVQLTAEPNDELYGSTTISGGTNDKFVIGDTVNLTATNNEGYTFIAWATSTDPETMQVLSTDPNYSFELSPTSSKKYYALFNKTTTSKTEGSLLKYTLYNEAKLAMLQDTTKTSITEEIEIPPIILNEDLKYRFFLVGDMAFYNCTMPSVILPEGVITIGARAFYNCRKLTSLNIPKTITTIGDSAFRSTKITNISIPEGITSIGKETFYYCSSLQSIEIPESVKTIGDTAFFGCSGLTSITLPNGLISIGNRSFSGCSNVASIVIPESVVSMGDNAFASCRSLVEVTVKKGVTSIGKNTFMGCASLITVNLPEGITEIGESTFSDCPALTSITLPNSITIIGNSAFKNCGKLTSIILPNSLTTIGVSAFNNCRQLTEITIPRGVTTIGDSAFCLSGLTSVIIPETVTTIGDFAFSGVNNYSYFFSDLTTVLFEKNSQLTTIGESAFSYCRNLTTINLPQSVNTIGNYAFYDCSSLTTFTIPENVISIGDGIFYTCDNLEAVLFSGDSKLESIGRSAFFSCKKLKSITIPKNVTTIGTFAFPSCISINVVEGNSVYRSVGNCLIQTTTKTLIAGCVNSLIPNDGSVTSIGVAAFDGCTKVASITLPEKITSIGEWAFRGCSALTTITIKAITPPSLGDSAIPSNVTAIYVPDASVEAYKAASDWSSVADRIFAVSQKP